TPFENFILDRNLRNGKPPGHWISLARPPALVVRRGSALACTLDDVGRPDCAADIVLLHQGFLMGDRDSKERVLKGHTEPPWLILFSPNGNKLVSCSDDGTARLWELTPNAAMQQFMAGQVTDPNIRYGKEITRFDIYNTDEDGHRLHGALVA